jgi:hypothetical protein
VTNIERRAQVVRRSRRRNGNPGAQKGRLQDSTTRVTPTPTDSVSVGLTTECNRERFNEGHDFADHPDEQSSRR